MRTPQPKPQRAAKLHGLRDGGVLAVWRGIDLDHGAGSNDPYTHQHLPERVGVPSFRQGRRWDVPKGAQYQEGGQYFTLYEMKTLQTLRRTFGREASGKRGRRCREKS